MKKHRQTIGYKTLPEFFNALRSGNKTFEIRKDKDNVQAGDILLLQEYEPEEQYYTGNILIFRVTYTLRNASEYGLMDGYVIIGLKRIPAYENNLGI